MTFWQSFISSVPLDTQTIQKRCQEGVIKLADYMNRLQDRLFEAYPRSYLSLVIRSHIIVVSRYVDDVFMEQNTFHFSQDTLSKDTLSKNTQGTLSNYLLKHPDLPLHIILQGGEADFRLASLKHVRFFDRPSLLRQIKMGEFSHNHWTQKFHAPTPDDSYRYVLAGVRPTQVLKNIVEFLSVHANPIAGVHLWPIMAAQQALSQIPTSPHKWVFILHQQDADFWHLIVCQKGAVVMYRHGFFDATKKIDQQLSKEVVATLRYLHRNGFQEGDGITILQSQIDPFTLPNDVAADVIMLDEPLTPYVSLLKRLNLQGLFSKLHIPFFPKASSTPSLWLPEFTSQRLAFLMPQILTHILPPFILFLLIGGGLFFFKAYGQGRYLNNVESQINKISITEADQKNLKSAHLFRFYKEHMPNKPGDILKTLSKALPSTCVATEIKWGPLDTKEFPLFLKAKITFDDAILAKPKKATKLSPLDTLQKKVEASVLKDFPKAHVQWQPTNSKYQFTLTITYGHDSN